MKLLADESVDGPIVARLRQAGHQILYVAEMAPGISDNVVLDTANVQEAILLTCDKDLGELVFRQGRLAAGSFWFALPDLIQSTRQRWLLLPSDSIRINCQAPLPLSCQE